MSSNRISLSFAVSFMLVLAVVTDASASAPRTSIELSPSEVRKTRAFWTAARMQQARPLDAGRPVSGGRPGGASRASFRGSPHSHSGRAPIAVAGGSSLSEMVADPTLPGNAVHGAVFIVFGDGLLGRCSATSVNAANLSVVFTAGHCVHLWGQWFDRKWVFVPGYHHGVRPFGLFVAKWLGSTPGWLSSQNQNFDVGAVVVTRNERGQRLGAAVGGTGIAWNLSPRQVFDVYGYPVEEPFNGTTLQRCPQTAFEGHDLLSFLSPGPLNLAVECNVTGGASGGGWLIKGKLLNGVTSSGYSDDPNTDFGPYFGRAVGRLYREAAAVR